MIKQLGMFIVFIIALHANAEGPKELCFPDLSNNSAIGGRTKLQPLTLTTCDPTVVVPGRLNFQIAYSQTTDGNNIAGFGSKDYHGVNLATDKIRLGMAFGKVVAGNKFEVGGFYTEYIDGRENFATRGAKGVHELIQKHRFIPKDSDPVGAHIGGVDVSDEVKRAVEGFIRYAPFEEDGKGGILGTPNVAVTISGRMPLSKSPLNTPSLGLDVQARKDINDWISVLGGIAYSCNTLKNGAFKGDDIRVKMCGADFFVGGAVTLWKKQTTDGDVTDRVYVAGGFSAQENRIFLGDNPKPAPLFNKVASFSLRYQGTKKYLKFDCGVGMTEGLEPRPLSFQDDATVRLDCQVSELQAKQLLQNVKSRLTQ